MNLTLKEGGIGMLIGKYSSYYCVALIALLLGGCAPETKSTDSQATAASVAWWYDIQFEPDATTVRGLDIRAIDANWKMAIALDASLLKGRISDSDITDFNNSKMSFSLESDFDGDGIAEEFFVGTYETSGSEIGRFVAIIRNGEVIQNFKENGTIGFSALLQSDDEVRWYKCLECGEYESIKWSGGSFSIE
ncbi:MAG: hypothetical protein LBE59_11145 [Nevskiaceae bacterium]|jgi:hypothetical protein|nr:hypothetical protein [Nevskiaceae bacterium]